MQKNIETILPHSSCVVPFNEQLLEILPSKGRNTAGEFFKHRNEAFKIFIGCSSAVLRNVMQFRDVQFRMHLHKDLDRISFLIISSQDRT